MRVLVTDGMDAGAVEQLRKDGYEIVEMRRDFCNKPRMVSATLSI